MGIDITDRLLGLTILELFGTIEEVATKCLFKTQCPQYPV